LIYFPRWREISAREEAMGVLGGKEPGTKTGVLQKTIGNTRATRELK
jgi:hypothetical protein